MLGALIAGGPSNGRTEHRRSTLELRSSSTGAQETDWNLDKPSNPWNVKGRTRATSLRFLSDFSITILDTIILRFHHRWFSQRQRRSEARTTKAFLGSVRQPTTRRGCSLACSKSSLGGRSLDERRRPSFPSCSDGRCEGARARRKKVAGGGRPKRGQLGGGGSRERARERDMAREREARGKKKKRGG